MAKIEGKIVAVTEAGDLVSDITVEQLAAAPRDSSVVIHCDDHETVGLFTPDHTEPPCTLLALLAPSGQLQLVIVGESAKIMLGIRIGTPITVSW
jgi:hypothetical protein